MPHTKTAIFAGGCFWCMEQTFETEVAGVVAVLSGYSGGTTPSPTYKNMGDHVEVVQVEYDPAKATYQQLLDVYWRNIDPTDPEGQFADKGHQYKSAIYYADDTEKTLAEASLAKVKAELKGETVYTQILPATPFYAAEEYHQNFYKTNEAHYKSYKYGSGRPQRLKEVWGAK